MNIMIINLMHLCHVFAKASVGTLKSQIVFQATLTELVVALFIVAVALIFFLLGRASGRKAARCVGANVVGENISSQEPSDEELVAVITAAITAMREEEAKQTGIKPTAFRVVSFKRTEKR